MGAPVCGALLRRPWEPACHPDEVDYLPRTLLNYVKHLKLLYKIPAEMFQQRPPFACQRVGELLVYVVIGERIVSGLFCVYLVFSD